MNTKKPEQLNTLLHGQREEWIEKRQNKIEKAITAFNHTHMSNTKWRKAFRILASPNLGLTRCHWKFLADERVFITSLPQEKDLLETHLADGRFQPEFVYREIEWIEIPAQYHIDDSRVSNRLPRIILQNVAEALEAMNKAGHFPVELLEMGLIIRGYS